MDTLETSARLDLTASANLETRTITGTATLFGVKANASTGAVIFERDSLTFPEDLRHVKLCLDHDTSRAVGYATAANITDDTLEMSFYVPPSPEGDEALSSAQNHVRDGLSVGAAFEAGGAVYDHDAQVLRVTAAQVYEVSLTAIPAFAPARVESVTLNRKEPALMDTLETPAENVEAAAAPPAPAPALMQSAPIMPAPARVIASAADAARAVVEMRAQGLPTQTIAAKLQDVTPASDVGQAFIGRETWLGALWEARRTDRPLIDSITSRPLGHTTKVKGWQWSARPEVAEYGGNKTGISSNKPTTKAIEADVKRIAAGWDIDRIFLDLGDPSMIEALWEGAVESYALKTEAAALNALLAAATDIGDPVGLPAALVALGAKAAARGSRIDFVAFGTQQWEQFTALKKDEVPWWLGGGDSVNLSSTSANVNGLRLFVDPNMTATSILAGDRRAATYFEAAPPIRVNAIDLPNGGVDLGLFGYYAVLVNDPASLFKIEA